MRKAGVLLRKFRLFALLFIGLIHFLVNFVFWKARDNLNETAHFLVFLALSAIKG